MSKFEVGEIVIALETIGDNIIKGKEYKVLKTKEEGIIVKSSLNDKELFYYDKRFKSKSANRIDEQIDKLNKWGELDYKLKLDSLNEDLRYIKRDIIDHRNALVSKYKREKKLMQEIELLEVKRNDKKDFKQDVEAILNNKYVTNLFVNGKCVYIETDYITIHDDEGNMFAGNKYRLEFNYKDMDCRIFGLDDDYSRPSWWANRYSHENDYHPHVSGENGSACWGSAGDMLNFAMNEYELFASFTIVLNFLQQVNLNDPAGKYIKNWDCIDEDGDVIDNPYESMYVCHICEQDLDEDDAYHCEECGETMCEEHEYWIDGEGIYVCDECYEDNFGTCYKCGERIRMENLEECSDCGEMFCEDCREFSNSENEYYCNRCFENNFTYCDGCDEHRLNQNTFTCDDCGETYCTDCNESNYYCGRNLCNDCYEEAKEEDEEDEE